MCKNRSGHSNSSMQHYERIAGTSCVKFKERIKDTGPPMLVQYHLWDEKLKIQADSGYHKNTKLCCLGFL